MYQFQASAVTMRRIQPGQLSGPRRRMRNRAELLQLLPRPEEQSQPAEPSWDEQTPHQPTDGGGGQPSAGEGAAHKPKLDPWTPADPSCKRDNKRLLSYVTEFVLPQ